MIRTLQHSILTFVDLAALAALIGTSFYLLYIGRPAEGAAGYPEAYWQRMRRSIFICLSLLTVNTAGGIIGRGMEMGGVGFTDSLPLLKTVAFKSHYGRIWFVRLTGILLAWAALPLFRRNTFSTYHGTFLLFIGVLVSFSRSASGHPSDYGDLSPQQIADWVHLLAISCWAGSLIVIRIIFPNAPPPEDISQQQFIARVGDRFYVAFGPLLALLVLAGMYNTWFQVGSFQALFTTPYGVLLSVKLLTILAISLWYIVPPQHGPDRLKFVTEFLRRTRREGLAVLAILLGVSLLIHMVPARHQVHLNQIRAAAEKKRLDTELSGPVVELSTNPSALSAGEPASISVRIKGPDSTPLKGIEISHERIIHCVVISKDLTVFAHIHPEEIGPITDEMMKKAVFPLRFTFPRAGEYLVAIDFAADDETFSKSFKVMVADPPPMARPKTDFLREKIFGDYRVTLITLPENVRAGGDATLKYFIQKNGKAVADLEPYLGAAMHLAVVPEDLGSFIHTHGTPPGASHGHGHLHEAPPPGRFGPEIEADIVFPAKGTYKVFSQVQHLGKVLLFDFMVTVQE